MADKLMYIPNKKQQITPLVDYNLWLKRMDLNLMNQLSEILLKSPKLLSQRMRKHYYTTLGTSVINNFMSPSSLDPMFILFPLLSIYILLKYFLP